MKRIFVLTILINLLGSSVIAQKGKNSSGTQSTTGQIAFVSASTTTGPYGTPVEIVLDNFPTTITSPLAIKFNGLAASIGPELIKDEFSSKIKFSTHVPKGAGSGPVTVYVNNTTISGPPFNYIKTIKEIVSVGFIGSENAQNPMGICRDGAGNFYIAGTSNNQIVTLRPDGNVQILAGSGSAGDNDGTGLNAQFFSPTGICCDGTGNLFVTSNSRIRKITPAGTVSTITRTDSFGIADGNIDKAKFYDPMGICIDSKGNLYVADYGRIRKITPSGEVSTMAGNGPGYADGNGANVKFGEMITGICIDDQGNIFVADASNNRIRKITTNGSVSTIAGSGISGNLDGTGTAAQFCNPTSICLDSHGNIFVGDRGSCLKGGPHLRMISAKGLVTTKTRSVSEFESIGSLNALLCDPQGNILFLNGVYNGDQIPGVDASIYRIIFE